MTVNENPTTTGRVDDIEVVETEDNTTQGARIRGGAVWGGLVVALGTFILLELLLLTTDLTGGTVSVANPDTGSWAWDGVAAIIAFFLGGLVAGASSPYREPSTGILNGVVIWAMGIVSIIVLTGLVGGAIFGALGDVIANPQNVQSLAQQAPAAQEAADNARAAAGWAAIGLALTLAAAAFGGLTGSKMWPRNRQDTTTRTRG